MKKRERKNKRADLSPNMPIITNVNHLNIPIKRQRLTEWDGVTQPNFLLSMRNSFQIYDNIGRFKNKE